MQGLPTVAVPVTLLRSIAITTGRMTFVAMDNTTTRRLRSLALHVRVLSVLMFLRDSRQESRHPELYDMKSFLRCVDIPQDVDIDTFIIQIVDNEFRMLSSRAASYDECELEEIPSSADTAGRYDFASGGQE